MHRRIAASARQRVPTHDLQVSRVDKFSTGRSAEQRLMVVASLLLRVITSYGTLETAPNEALSPPPPPPLALPLLWLLSPSCT